MCRCLRHETIFGPSSRASASICPSPLFVTPSSSREAIRRLLFSSIPRPTARTSRSHQRPRPNAVPVRFPQTHPQLPHGLPTGQADPSIRSARLTSRLDLWYSSSRNGLNSEGTQRLKAGAGLAKATVFSLSPPRYFPVTHVAQHRRGGQFSPLRGIAGSSARLRRTSAPSLGVP